MKKDYTLITGVVSFLVVIAIAVIACHVKASALNHRYGTDFSAWDIMLGIEKNYRKIN